MFEKSPNNLTKKNTERHQKSNIHSFLLAGPRQKTLFTRHPLFDSCVRASQKEVQKDLIYKAPPI